MPNVKWTKQEFAGPHQFNSRDPEGARTSRLLSLSHDDCPCLEMAKAQFLTDLLGPVSPEMARVLIGRLVDRVGKARVHVAYREMGDQIWLACWQSEDTTPWPEGAGRAPAWSGMAPKGPHVLWDNLSDNSNLFRYDTDDNLVRVATGFTGCWPNEWHRNLIWTSQSVGPTHIPALGPMPFGVAHKLLQELWELEPDQNWLIPYRLINGLVVLGIAKADWLNVESTELPEWFLNS